MQLSMDQTLTSPTPTSALEEPEGDDRQSRVARRAHELFVARGMAPGHDMEDWLEAEREIDATSE